VISVSSATSAATSTSIEISGIDGCPGRGAKYRIARTPHHTTTALHAPAITASSRLSVMS
jgi:hypothetical protein